MKRIIYFSLTLFVMLGMLSCSDDDDNPSLTIADIIVADDNYSTLEAALERVDLLATLDGTAAFTIFAPTNAAFGDLLTTLGASSLADIPDETLESVLLYHVLTGEAFSGDLSTQNYTTLNGADISVNVSSGVVINGTSNVVNPFDTDASNGVIHTIDEVLLPPVPTVVDIISNSSDHTILLAALTKFPDLVDDINNATEQTIFAPTNAAFADLLMTVGQTELDDIPDAVIRTILENHVVTSGTVLSSDLSDGQEITTAGGEMIGVVIDNNGVFVEGAEVTNPNVEGSNGVVHITSAVLVPRSVAPIVNTIVEPAYFNKDYSILIEAVLAADEDILSVLLGNGPSDGGLTLFAPNNDAFEAAGITTLPDATTLSAVLKYHVIDATVMAMDIASGSSTAETLGGDIYLSNVADGVFINGSTEVVATDIEADNGVVHLIDRTLLPPSDNIVEIATAMGFNELAAAVVEAGLDGTLSGAGDFTVFAPTDAAFEALYTTLGVNGPEEIDDDVLEDVLLYHVLGSRVFSVDLSNDQVVETLSDASSPTTFTIAIDGTVILEDNDPDLEDAEVTDFNILATNGVIHAVDQVMIPIDL